MQPTHYDLLGQVPDDQRPHHQHPLQSCSPSGAPNTRSEDSWIEVSSQPSSSSLSSAATNDDIITTGLRVEQNDTRPYHHRRSQRRRLQHLAAVTTTQVDYSSREQSSSQDEYDESESESDRVLSSSNEDVTSRRPVLPRVAPVAAPSTSVSDAIPSSDDDDNSTALGMRISSSPFVPQPNVFSHPPATQHPSWTRPSERHHSLPSEVSTSSRRTAIRRNSQPSNVRRQTHQHSPYNMISPSYHADHDAALRASLSTLLSCAAAARGLPKTDSQNTQPGPSRPPPQQASSFRLVSESVALGEDASEDEVPSTAETNTSTRSPRSKPHPLAAYPSAKVKRRSSSPKDRSSSHAAKKSRRAGTSESPTMMTWVISAGVVVLFSAISFSAGYVLGREVGRLEASAGVVDGNFSSSRASARCGQEAVKGGLKRFRWGSGVSGSGIVA